MSEATYSRQRLFFDVLAVANILAVALLEIGAFPEGGTGFRIYSAAVLGVFVTLWLTLRRWEHPWWLVLILQAALLGHVAGRLVIVDGEPLYRAALLGVGMDKVIHAFNSMAAAAFLTVFFRRIQLQLRGWEGFIIVMTISGCAALVEIIEYLGVLVLPATHVGGYANNAQDLIANVTGASIGWAIAHGGLAARRGSASPRRTP